MLNINCRDFISSSRTDWNRELMSYDQATFRNTAESAMVDLLLSGDSHKNICFLGISDSNKEIAKGLILLQSLPALYSGLLARKCIKLLAPFFKIVTWMHAPIVLAEFKESVVVEIFLDWAVSFAKKKGAFYIEASAPPHYQADQDKTSEIIYKKWGFSRTEKATVILDLGNFMTVNDCWNNLNGDVKDTIKKAERSGIEVVEDKNMESADEYVDLHKKTNYPITPFYRNEALFKKVVNLYNSDKASPICKLFITSKDGVLLSGQLAFIFNKIVILEGVVISETCRHNKWHANDLMQWHIIKWAKENNFRLIDWGGYALDPTKKEKGINHFKLKWGGEIYKFNTYSKVIIPWKYRIFCAAKNLKRQLIN